MDIKFWHQWVKMEMCIHVQQYKPSKSNEMNSKLMYLFGNRIV